MEMARAAHLQEQPRVSKPITTPDLILLFGASELEVDFDDVLKPFLELRLLEPRVKTGEGYLG
jgi:hypothetical protein